MNRLIRLKLIVSVFLVLSVFVLSIIPSYAFDGSYWNVYVTDNTSSYSLYSQVSQVDDPLDYTVVYDDDKISLFAVYPLDTVLIYEIFVPEGYNVYFYIYDDEQVDYNETIFEYGNYRTVNGTLYPTYDSVYVCFEYRTTLVTQTELEQAERDAYQNGLSASSQNAQIIYQQGFNDGVGDGYNKGLVDSKNAQGLLNVALSSVYYVSTYLTSQIGIFGVSLGNILVSLMFILLVFFVFKIVK